MPSARGAGLRFDLNSQTQARAQSRELLQAAFTAHEAGDLTRALTLLDQAERLRPDQPDAYNLRGAILMKQGDYARAEAAFARAVALDPELWAARFNLAEVPFRRKDYVRARTLFDRLVTQTDRYKRAGQWELAQYKAGLSCLLQGDEPGAQRRFAKLPPGAPGSAAAFYAQAALAYARRDPAAAGRLLANAQATCPPAANTLFARTLEGAGWMVPTALPVAAPALAAAARSSARPASRLVPMANVPIPEPELPAGTAASITPGTLIGARPVAAGPAPTQAAPAVTSLEPAVTTPATERPENSTTPVSPTTEPAVNASPTPEAPKS